MVNKLGRCHNLEPKRVPWGEFLWQPLLTGLVFYVFFLIFCLDCALYKIHTQKLFAHEKVVYMQKNQKQKKVFGKRKKKKENRSKEESKRIPFVKRLVLAELHAGAQIWTKKSPRIIILKAVCRFVFLLLSTFYSFSIFAAGFTFAFLQLCPLLCRPPQRSNERSR